MNERLVPHTTLLEKLNEVENEFDVTLQVSDNIKDNITLRSSTSCLDAATGIRNKTSLWLDSSNPSSLYFGWASRSHSWAWFLPRVWFRMVVCTFALW